MRDDDDASQPTARPPSRRAKTSSSSADDDLGGQTLNIDAVEENGEVTGEFRITDDRVHRVECADTDTDGVVILGGEVTKGLDNFGTWAS